MTSKNKNVFITGGNGFIGSNLARLLIKKNYNVNLLARKNSNLWRLKEINKDVKIHQCEIEDIENLKKIITKLKPKYIIHLASYGNSSSENNLKKMIDVNILGLVNLLEASKKINYKKLIICGSSSEYGFKKKPIAETDFLDPNSYYSATKGSATLIAQSYALEENKPIVILRPFSVYGPFEENNRFIPTIIKKAVSNEKVLVTKEEVKRDFVFIDDVVNAFYKSMELKTNKGELINIGTGKQYSNKEIIKIIEKILKLKLKLGIFPKRVWDTSNWVTNNLKAKRVLKWYPENSIEQGLRQTVEWYRTYYV